MTMGKWFLFCVEKSKRLTQKRNFNSHLKTWIVGKRKWCRDTWKNSRTKWCWVQAHMLATLEADKLRNKLLGWGIADLIQKANRPIRWWTRVPKNHLVWVRIQAPFILAGEGVKPNISWCQSASRGDVFISFLWQPFTWRPGQDASCVLKTGTVA